MRHTHWQASCQWHPPKLSRTPWAAPTGVSASGGCVILYTSIGVLAGGSVCRLGYGDWMTLRELQQLIETMYSAKDRTRGSTATFLWLTEEIGELAAALRAGTKREKADEFADVLAWLATLANVEGIDLDEVVQEKYGGGCPGCGKMVCTCEAKP